MECDIVRELGQVDEIASVFFKWWAFVLFSFADILQAENRLELRRHFVVELWRMKNFT